MNIIDKGIRAVAPQWAFKRDEARTKSMHHQTLQKTVNQGYGSHGASRIRKSLLSFIPGLGDAKDDILDNLPDLRARSRDLFMGGALSNGALKAMRTNVVGTGLRLKATPDTEFLGLNEDQAQKLKRQIEREWNLWAESKDCDANGLHNLYELQQLAFISELMSGDVFALLPDLPRKHSVYDLRIRLVEADRCNNKERLEDTQEMMGGMELDQDGMVVAYYFSSRHIYSNSIDPLTWTRVAVKGELTGRRNVLHLMNAERPDQRRGVPVLAPVIESMKQLERYTDAELNAAVISAMFTVFIEKENETPEEKFGGLEFENDFNEPLAMGPTDLKLGNGAVQFLEPGEKATFANPSRPATNFDSFVLSILRQVGSALEVPYELLLKNFTSSYSASRGALLEAWKMFKMRRSWLASDFCQPVFEEWFAEAVTKGRIDAPGIFDDPLIFKAYTRSEWHGPSYGMLDPVKEVSAAISRVENGFSTHQREAAELTGTEYESNIRQLAYEQKVKSDYGIANPEGSTLQIVEPQEEDDSDDELRGGETSEDTN